ncbi:hypothetical protein SDC9_104255 [bioreactor metagenome]|uniref:Uncharacterized protein n=1 Tax=bioreactor metagenome TaxID=1076179 RepID=A0A645B2N9_9ZZZZ
MNQAGEHLLAHAVFPPDQNGGVGAGHGHGLSDEIAVARVPADHLKPLQLAFCLHPADILLGYPRDALDLLPQSVQFGHVSEYRKSALHPAVPQDGIHAHGDVFVHRLDHMALPLHGHALLQHLKQKGVRLDLVHASAHRFTHGYADNFAVGVVLKADAPLPVDDHHAVLKGVDNIGKVQLPAAAQQVRKALAGNFTHLAALSVHHLVGHGGVGGLSLPAGNLGFLKNLVGQPLRPHVGAHQLTDFHAVAPLPLPSPALPGLCPVFAILSVRAARRQQHCGKLRLASFPKLRCLRLLGNSAEPQERARQDTAPRILSAQRLKYPALFPRPGAFSDTSPCNRAYAYLQKISPFFHYNTTTFVLVQ